MADPHRIRCAVYTRKSSEEGLEQSFNSLHAQREACEAYIASQKHEGWQLITTAYDDGGFSGGTMERPGLKALLADVEAGLIDTVVVYKVDRLTRALSDFARMVDRFDARQVSFVSVTQAFNTTTSMGRLTLNVLLSFAQFEREVTGERIRDKIAASKAKGMWMGGVVPLGYDVVERALVINEPEAAQVRELFALYLKHRTVDAVIEIAAKRGIRSKARLSATGRSTGGTKLGRGSLYAILANPIYAGEIGHKGKRFAGQHQRIVPPELYDPVQALLAANRRKARGTGSGPSSHKLSGLVFDGDGQRMTATHTGKANRRYCYYASAQTRVPAADLDTLVLSALRDTLGTPASLVGVLPSLDLLSPGVLQAGKEVADNLAVDEDDRCGTALGDLIARVEVREAGVTTYIRLDPLGLAGEKGCVVTPASLARTATRLSLVVPGKVSAKPDPSLIAVIAQARHWLGELTSGRCTSIQSVADACGVTPAYVRQLIGLGFLAPDLVQRIVEGRQPEWLSLSRLTAMLPLPIEWSAQQALLAVPA